MADNRKNKNILENSVVSEDDENEVDQLNVSMDSTGSNRGRPLIPD